MRKILSVIIFTLSFCLAKAQFTIPQNLGSINTQVTSTGGFKAALGFIPPIFADTLSANNGKTNFNNNSLIIVGNSFWRRDSVNHVWVLMTATSSCANGLRPYTGIVSYDSLLVFSVTPASYGINGGCYSSAATNITLNAADPSLNRQDVIAVDTNNNVIKITGVPATNPAAPQINPASQLALTTVFVPAGSTVPNGIATTIIYNENIEWSGSTSGVTANFNNTLTPYIGVKATDVGAFTDGNTVAYTNISSVNAVDFSLFKMYIRLKSTLASTANLQLFLTRGGVIQTQPFLLGGAYNFSKTITGTYQNVSIPMTAFAFRSDIIMSDKHPFDGLLIKMTGANANGYLLDWIQLQSGISQGGGTGSDFVTQNYASNDTLYYVKSGVNYPFYVVKKDSLAYISSNKINDSTFSLCRRSAICDTFVIHSTGGGGGGAFIPLSGTVSGSPVTGPIELSSNEDNPNSFFMGDVNSNVNQWFRMGSTLGYDWSLNSFDPLSGSSNMNMAGKDFSFSVKGLDLYLASLSLGGDKALVIQSQDPLYRGINGLQDFTPNITDLDYVQLKGINQFITVTGDYTDVTKTTHTINVDVGASNAIITLPDATAILGSTVITIKADNATTTGTITINSAGGNVQNVLGAFNSSAILQSWGTLGDILKYQSDGTNWHLVGH